MGATTSTVMYFHQPTKVLPPASYGQGLLNFSFPLLNSVLQQAWPQQSYTWWCWRVTLEGTLTLEELKKSPGRQHWTPGRAATRDWPRYQKLSTRRDRSSAWSWFTVCPCCVGSSSAANQKAGIWSLWWTSCCCLGWTMLTLGRLSDSYRATGFLVC